MAQRVEAEAEMLEQSSSGIRSFVGREGHHFVVDGQPFYVNGWNSYWLMTQAVEENTRPRVVSTFLHGAALGMTVCRTWAFNDAAYDALQTSPGDYSEKTFQVVRSLNHFDHSLHSYHQNLSNPIARNTRSLGFRSIDLHLHWSIQDSSDGP